MRTAAGYLGMRGDVHTVTYRGEPALEVTRFGALNGTLGVLLGMFRGPALLSARRHVCAQRTPREGYTHGANAVLRLAFGPRTWPPGSCLSPSWGLRVGFFNFWAGWPGGFPAWTHSSYTPT